MRKELGKWLMDMAKYLIVVMALFSIIGLNSPIIIGASVVSAAVALVTGLWLIKESDSDKG